MNRVDIIFHAPFYLGQVSLIAAGVSGMGVSYKLDYSRGQGTVVLYPWKWHRNIIRADRIIRESSL